MKDIEREKREERESRASGLIRLAPVGEQQAGAIHREDGAPAAEDSEGEDEEEERNK